MAYNESEPTPNHVNESPSDAQYQRRNGFEIQTEDNHDDVNDNTVVLSPQDTHPEEEQNTVMSPMPPLPRSTSSKITRTVAIIKTHALNHRFEVETRIQEAGFEIVKERQMVFDTETDPETLDELFGEDALSLAEGPVWVYVLERHRAVEVWNTLMGPRDPAVAATQSPNSLRAMYGLSLTQNGFMGSPDVEIAEIQIASLFASSPPFPTTELPSGSERFDSLRSVTSSVLEAIRQNAAASEHGDGYAASSTTQPSTVGGESRSTKSGSGSGRTAGRKSSFRARDLPATHVAPDIKPRMSRAAALRAGLPVEKTSNGPKAPPTKERLAQTFANVPGHKRAETIQVASTAAPTIAPRMTRAASLRLGLTPPTPTARPRPSVAPANKAKAKDAPAEPKKGTFEGVPGHKRRESIAVASAKAPTIAPRLNKSAALRQQKDSAPPSSFMFRGPSTQTVPGLSRSNSVNSLGGNDAAKLSRPASQSSVRAAVPRPSLARPASMIGVWPPSATPKPTTQVNGKAHTPDVNGTANGTEKSEAPVKRKPRPSSLAAPTIAPRPNKSAMLRAAKMEAQNAAAAAATAKAPRRKLGPAVA